MVSLIICQAGPHPCHMSLDLSQKSSIGVENSESTTMLSWNHFTHTSARWRKHSKTYGASMTPCHYLQQECSPNDHNLTSTIWRASLPFTKSGANQYCHFATWNLHEECHWTITKLLSKTTSTYKTTRTKNIWRTSTQRHNFRRKVVPTELDTEFGSSFCTPLAVIDDSQ